MILHLIAFYSAVNNTVDVSTQILINLYYNNYVGNYSTNYSFGLITTIGNKIHKQYYSVNHNIA